MADPKRWYRAGYVVANTEPLWYESAVWFQNALIFKVDLLNISDPMATNWRNAL
jgi:hypothetical protein